MANTELTVYDVNQFRIAPANIETMTKAVSGMADEGLTQFDLPSVTVPSSGATSWEITTLAGTETAKTIKGIILGSQRVRAFYKDKYQGGGTPPDCASPDGITGYGIPGGSCATCPKSVWGSGENNSQLCSERKHILILPENQNIPTLLNLPPTSLGTYKAYLMRLIAQGLPAYGVVTEIGLRGEKNATGIAYSEVTFNACGFVPEESIVQMEKLAELFTPLITSGFNMNQPRPAPTSDEEPNTDGPNAEVLDATDYVTE